MVELVATNEYGSVDVHLPPDQLDEFMAADTTNAISVGVAAGGGYRLTAGSKIGAIVSPSLSVLIRPKIALENVFMMLGVSIPEFMKSTFEFDDDTNLLDAMVAVFAHAADVATARGVLRGYREVEDRLVSPRGRIDITQQLRRPGAPVPVACRFDEHTADILLNRGLLAAVARLSRVPGLSPVLRERLVRLRPRFEEVSTIDVNPNSLDHWRPGRLDRHYETAVRLASMVLQNLSLRDQVGGRPSASFTIDMNKVFQDFVADRLARGLRGRLDVKQEPTVRLAEDGARSMLPDLVFERSGVRVYVGDSKYKLSSGEARTNDYYQLLAYTTVMELDEGVLVYCQDTDEEPEDRLLIRNSGKTLVTYRLPMSGTVQEVEGELEKLAEWIHTAAGQRLAVA